MFLSLKLKIKTLIILFVQRWAIWPFLQAARTTCEVNKVIESNLVSFLRKKTRCGFDR